MSIESVMSSNHLIFRHPLLLLPSVFPIIRVFSSESALHFSKSQSIGASASASVLSMNIQVWYPLELVFPVVMYGCELDYKESWVPKDWCFWTVVLEKTLENPLDCKEIQPVHPKGNHSWIFIGRTDAEPETSIVWPPDVKNWLIWKDLDAGKDWRQKEKGTTNDEMV